jgi:hypothetical protein
MQQTDATPWYPTARLLRQSRPGDWYEVVARVIGELSQLRAARPLRHCMEQPLAIRPASAL